MRYTFFSQEALEHYDVSSPSPQRRHRRRLNSHQNEESTLFGVKSHLREAREMFAV